MRKPIAKGVVKIATTYCDIVLIAGEVIDIYAFNNDSTCVVLGDRGFILDFPMRKVFEKIIIISD